MEDELFWKKIYNSMNNNVLVYLCFYLFFVLIPSFSFSHYLIYNIKMCYRETVHGICEMRSKTQWRRHFDDRFDEMIVWIRNDA